MAAPMRTVLVIVADPGLCLAVRRLVERAGATALCAAAGEAALAHALPGGVDLILLDHPTPGADGLDALAALRRDARTRSAAVVFCTPVRDVDLHRRAADLGAIAVVDAADLDPDRVRAWLEPVPPAA